MKDSKLYRFLRPILTAFTKIVFRPRYVGLENISSEKGFVLAGTHTSNLDCLLLMSSTKRSIHFLAKQELWHGVKKIIFANMGLIPVNRKEKNHRATLQAEAYLKNQEVVGIFPEGTTEKGRGLLPFKMGTVKIAKDTNSPIIPFAIVGNYKFFQKKVTIVFGKPYQIKESDLSNANEVLRNKVKKLMKIGEQYGKDT